MGRDPLIHDVGTEIVIAKDIHAVVSRVIWDGEAWSYELLWVHDGDVVLREFSFSDLQAIVRTFV